MTIVFIVIRVTTHRKGRQMTQRNILGAIGPRVNTGAIVAALLNGNATVSTTGAHYNGSGILVAIPERGFLLTPDAIDCARLIADWVNSAAHAITNFPAPFYNPRYFGSWTDNEGHTYFDIVEAFPREFLSEAIAAGIARDQIAIWDNGRKELIATSAVA